MIRNKCLICKSNQFLTSLIKLEYSSKYIKRFLDDYYSVSSSKNILQNIKYLNYEIIKCKKCQFIWQKFIPNQKFLKNLYEVVIDKDQSLKKSIYKHQISRDNDKIQVNQVIHLVNKKDTKIKVLDYGAGWGHWAKNIESEIIKVFCLEYSKSRTKHIKKLKLNLVHKNKIIKKNIKFDFIRCEQVVEHLPELQSTLSFLHKILNKNGIIYISVPDGNKIIHSNKFSKNYIKKGPVQPLEHLNCFNNFSLNKILKMNNFKRVPIQNLIYAKLHSNKLSFKNYKSIFRDIYDYYFGTTLIYTKN
mgnify:FL=1|tara:strand:- start:25349 stop:26257 length:909 start_codon:yes stop_codon:yes gene_type:complete